MTDRLAQACSQLLQSSNVQAVDYLAGLINKPLKIFMASEAGVRHVLDQYKTDFSSIDAAAEVSEEEANKEESSEIKTIVQDSPISRALRIS